MANPCTQLSLEEAVSEKEKERFIQEHEQTILRMASASCHRYITKSDDEWSVALYAFSRAIDLYAAAKGEFFSFAKLLIKRDLIDYFRANKKAESEITVAPHVLEGNGEPEEDTEGVYLSMVKASRQAVDNSLQEEIMAANEMLEDYGFRFFDLTECSPKQDRTKNECAKAIRWMLQNEELKQELKHTKKLPIKAISSGSSVSRKILDKYRKYLIMAILILDGDYPHIAEYLKFVKEGEIE